MKFQGQDPKHRTAKTDAFTRNVIIAISKTLGNYPFYMLDINYDSSHGLIMVMFIWPWSSHKEDSRYTCFVT